MEKFGICIFFFFIQVAFRFSLQASSSILRICDFLASKALIFCAKLTEKDEEKVYDKRVYSKSISRSYFYFSDFTFFS